MEDERRRILEMVEQGKISAQEANDLLAALDEPEERPAVESGWHQRRFCRGRGDWSRVGETMGDVVEAVMKSLFRGVEERGERRGWRRRREE